MSLYLQATTTAVWAPIGVTPEVAVHPGRENVHFYGSLNLHDGKVTVRRTTEMNNVETAKHLQQLLDAYPEHPLLLLWDKAPWHGGEAVRQLLSDNPRLKLMRLPTAAPDLNPQEHVWKAARQAKGHNHDQRELGKLADRFEAYLSDNKFPCSLLEKYNHSTLCAMFK